MAEDSQKYLVDSIQIQAIKLIQSLTSSTETFVTAKKVECLMLSEVQYSKSKKEIANYIKCCHPDLTVLRGELEKWRDTTAKENNESC